MKNIFLKFLNCIEFLFKSIMNKHPKSLAFIKYRKIISQKYLHLTKSFSFDRFNESTLVFHHFYEIMHTNQKLRNYGDLIVPLVEKMINFGASEFILVNQYLLTSRLYIFCKTFLPQYETYLHSLITLPHKENLIQWKTIYNHHESYVQSHDSNRFLKLKKYCSTILESILKYDWHLDIDLLNFHSLFAQIQNIKYGVCKDEYIVVRHESEIVIDDQYVDHLISSLIKEDSLEEEELLAKVALYVMHELIHVLQKIDDKKNVYAIRKTGAESLLMSFDLNADHLATIFVNRIFPKWSLAWLKCIQGYSLIDFPISKHHLQASIQRKQKRLLSSRMNYLITKYQQSPNDQYAFYEIQYSRIGGDILVIQMAPIQKLFARGEILLEEAELLNSIGKISNRSLNYSKKDMMEQLIKIDDILERIFFTKVQIIHHSA